MQIRTNYCQWIKDSASFRNGNFVLFWWVRLKNSGINLSNYTISDEKRQKTLPYLLKSLPQTKKKVLHSIGLHIPVGAYSGLRFFYRSQHIKTRNKTHDQRILVFSLFLYFSIGQMYQEPREYTICQFYHGYHWFHHFPHWFMYDIWYHGKTIAVVLF